MKTTNIALAIVLIVILVTASAYGTYTLLSTSPSASPTPSPSATAIPSASPTPEQNTTVTVVDKTGTSVEVKTPVERIVNIAPGGVEFICALGGGDKIVGRDEYSTFPPSVIDIPVVATSSFSPNMEQILELTPDLVLADQGLSDENRQTLENAGVPVLVEMLMEPRLKTAVTNLGIILQAEEKANEFINFTTTYQNLVQERITDVPANETPLVFFEWYQPWYSATAGDSYDEMIISAGGVTLVPEEGVTTPQLSPEYVTEQNPDIVLRMLTRLDGEDLAAYQTLRDSILNRTALSQSTAVKEGNVFIIHNSLLVLRPAIGLLYMAKWFHPTLFDDIDPAAVHEQMVHQFFGENVTLEGVYAYP